MSKREQALRIEPKNEIHFKGPYNRVVTEYFHLANPTDKSIAFKVKTTAPKRYCVRPNNGTIAPGKSVNVAVMLQPLTTGDQATPAAAIEKNKHKFMIQSVFAAADSTANPDDLFKTVSTEDIMDSKFRCVFDENVSTTGGSLTSNNLSVVNNSSGSTNNSSNKLTTAGSDSDNETNADQKYLAEDLTSTSSAKYGSLSNDHGGLLGSDISSSIGGPGGASSSSYVTSMADSTLLTNGGDEDARGYSSASTVVEAVASSTGTLATSAAPTSSSSSSTAAAGGGAVPPTAADLKRVLDENYQLRAKIQDLERVARASGGGGGAYNRFGTAAGSSTGGSPKSQTSTTSSAAPSILDQPLSGQVILTVLISLLIGFILGKIDLGLF